MSRKLFGTDGIRGVAGKPPLDPATAYALGVALGAWVHSASQPHEVVIGMDTRESGTWLAESVAGGLKLRGIATRFAGIVTTPGVAYLARTGPFAAGVMISASHNPYLDNGLKVIDHSGFKMPDELELRLEHDMFAWLGSGQQPERVELTVDEGLDRKYVDYLASTMPVRLDGMRLVIDCANGAAYQLAPELFERLGAQVSVIGDQPDGRNINLDCGSTHLDHLKAAVAVDKPDLGIAFDGDADRALFISPGGKMIDGDQVLLLAAKELDTKTVVATVMSNLALEVALREDGRALVRTAVGDKYVLEEMIKQDLPIGGEQSGHIIFRRYATTGDGILTALRVIEIIRKSGKSVDELLGGYEIYPQILVNVRVKERKALADLPAVQQEIREAERELGDRGRVLVRFSGTEPLARVMVEGAEKDSVTRLAEKIADSIRVALA